MFRVVRRLPNYDSFGKATNTSFPTQYQYTGREYDSLTGLMYYRARWYDANLGRFISEDPIGFDGGDVNLYGYVGNNPINKVDALGFKASKAQCKALRELIERENLHGTGPASWISSVTFNVSPSFGGTALDGLNNRAQGDLTVDGKPFDIDWFVDSNAVSGGGFRSKILGPAAYFTGKMLWSRKNIYTGESQTYTIYR